MSCAAVSTLTAVNWKKNFVLRGLNTAKKITSSGNCRNLLYGGVESFLFSRGYLQYSSNSIKPFSVVLKHIAPPEARKDRRQEIHHLAHPSYAPVFPHRKGQCSLLFYCTCYIYDKIRVNRQAVFRVCFRRPATGCLINLNL